MRAAAGSRPRTCGMVYILVTLCRFDHNPGSRSYSGPFIPTRRRLAYMEILEIQGRDFGTGFRIGSMAGLMMLFSRHSWFMTNFKILYLNLALFSPEASTGARGAQVCGEGQEGLGVPGWTRNSCMRHRLGPGNTNKPLGTGYYPSPGTHPVYPSPVPTRSRTPACPRRCH